MCKDVPRDLAWEIKLLRTQLRRQGFLGEVWGKVRQRRDKFARPKKAEDAGILAIATTRRLVIDVGVEVSADRAHHLVDLL